MEAAWRFRIMLLMAFFVILFGDFLGYGNAKVENKNPPHLDFDDEASHVGTSEQINHSNQLITGENSQKNVQIKLSEALRESCLPKLLCEMAARPDHTLSDRERNLLGLIKSTTMSLTMMAPSKWHFASHMGQLLRADASVRGCAELYPNCPYSSQTLMKISTRVTLK